MIVDDMCPIVLVTPKKAPFCGLTFMVNIWGSGDAFISYVVTEQPKNLQLAEEFRLSPPTYLSAQNS